MAEEKIYGTNGSGWHKIFLLVLFIGITLISLEIGLRGVKSVMLDGILYLSSPSINSRPHEKYGWISHSSFEYEKHDDCYGSGIVRYNEAGFRAPSISQANDADVKICILGDSTMQGYQMPDGEHLPFLLANELEQSSYRPYVLPLAVGGYGSVQQWMLFEDYCNALDPDMVIWHWAKNDPTNNSYLADRYSGPNNARLRPYYENGEILLRKAYPIRISDTIDHLMTIKLLNGLILRYSEVQERELTEYRETGWEVAEIMAKRVADSVQNRVALVMSTEERAIEMFSRLGYKLAIYEPFSSDMKCLPKDSHPNPQGHKHMLNALMPVINEALVQAYREN